MVWKGKTLIIASKNLVSRRTQLPQTTKIIYVILFGGKK